VVVPASSAYYCVTWALVSYMFWFNTCILSLVVIMSSPTFLSDSFIRFCRADVCILYWDAVVLSLIISALFAEIAVCISEHMRPYYCIVKVFLSIPLDNITCWLCSILQFSDTFLSKVLIVLFASTNYDLMKFVNSVYYLS
jgi:hypothetical protein